jgi:hypothetical protein
MSRIPDPGPCRHVRFLHGDHKHRGKPSYGKVRAECTTCWWRGPWCTFQSTATRHRDAHLYLGRHRA